MKQSIVVPLLALTLTAAACSWLPQRSGSPSETSDGSAAPSLWEGLGNHVHPITTSSPRAQQYFDQGMAFVFGFNHEAAIDAFREAARLDPACAMCVWGEALALGPNINAPMGPAAAAQAHARVQHALTLSAGSSPAERAYIEALATRYADPPPEDRASLDRAYADAMRQVRTAYPDDLDAATLAAEALMDLYPWNYWLSESEPRPETQEALDLLEGVLSREPTHLGANHYLIHTVEEYFPERAEPAADRLGALAPDAGHLVHMPSHIYWRVGRYQDAMEINQRATQADEDFFATCRPGTFYRALYYPHNVHFLWAAAAAEGRSQIALTAARKLAAKTKGGLEQFPFMSEFMAIPMLTLARFGRWDAVLGEPRPDATRPYLSGIWHYTRGLARIRNGDLEAATSELDALVAQALRPEAEALILAGGTASARSMLEIGIDHLRGELAAAQGDYDLAVGHLESAVARQDSLVYMEPPPWYLPSRQALGAILLDAGRPADAERIYREDLVAYPKNGWSRLGLAQSLLAQSKDATAAQADFAEAWNRADVTLTSSRF